MKNRIQNAIDEIATEARGRYDELLKGARQTTRDAAKQVGKGKAPLQTVTRLGLELTAVGHRTADNALKHNKKFLINRMDALTERLRTAAGAECVRDLVKGQLKLFPENVAQFRKDTRGAVDIAVKAGGEVRELFAGTVAELKGDKPASRARPAKKKAKRTKSPSTKKKAARSTKAKPEKTSSSAQAA
jgi:hypothetical protein